MSGVRYVWVMLYLKFWGFSQPSICFKSTQKPLVALYIMVHVNMFTKLYAASLVSLGGRALGLRVLFPPGGAFYPQQRRKTGQEKDSRSEEQTLKTLLQTPCIYHPYHPHVSNMFIG